MMDLTFDRVRFRLGTTDFAFDGSVPPGSLTALTGPSGAGKSTLINLIAGFDRPDSGRILAGGRDLGTLFPGKRPLSLIFQDHNLFAHLTIEANVGLGINPALRLSAAERHAVGTALEQVGLAGFGPRLPASLSGGERQRAAFARALVRHRPILLADEPFAALDPDLRIAMGNLMRDLATEARMTVLFVSHDDDEVLRLATHRLHVMHGRIALSGEPDAVAAALRRGKSSSAAEMP